jgi:uncharacterized membrane protein YczE
VSFLPPRRELARRLPRCIGGLACFGFGISCIVRARLGLAPWDVFHQGLSDLTGLSLGLMIEGMGLLILLLWIPLRQRPGLGTVLNAIEIGLVADLGTALLPETTSIFARWTYLAAGLLVIGIGSGFYIGAGLGTGPRDGLMVGLNRRFGWSIRRSRTVVELLALGAGIALGGPIGIGTLVLAFGIGPIAHFTIPRLSLPPIANEPPVTVH